MTSPFEKCKSIDAILLEEYLTKVHDYEQSTIISEKITEGKRYYTIPNGAIYPSVTTVISAMADKQWIQDWYDRVGEKTAKDITESACIRGSSMHDTIFRYFKGESIDVAGTGYPLFQKLRIYLQLIRPIGLELPLWSSRLRIAGRTDCIGYYKGHLSIIDYKTSRSEKTPNQILNYFQQSAYYSMMLLERLDIAAKKIVILIGVENGFPQEFIRDANTYIKDNVTLASDYHRMFPISSS